MARGKQLHHPLTLLFWSRKFTIEAGMDWLQQNGHISDHCQSPEEVAPCDVLRVLDLAGTPMFASAKYRAEEEERQYQEAVALSLG